MLLIYGDTLGYIRTEEDKIEQALGVIMGQQYSLKAGLKLFGEKGEHAVTSELDKLHDIETFATLNDNKLTKKDGADSLVSLMLLT